MEADNCRPLDILKKTPGLTVKSEVEVARLTHMRVQGQIDNFLIASSPEALQVAVRQLHTAGLRWKILGAGSNVIIGAMSPETWIIKLGKDFDLVEQSGEDSWYLGAASPLIRASSKLTQAGWSGLEFAAGIPASVGGAVAMNAGAHGSCMAEVVESIRVMQPDGQIVDLPADQAEFDYRTSMFNREDSRYVVLGTTLSLRTGDPELLMKTRQDALQYRKDTQPLWLPSSGSVFKNPSPDISAGFLLEQAGMKGRRVGGAQISEMHANWIVNPEKKASPSDVWNLIRECQDAVAVPLHPELQIWGNVQV